MFDFKKHCTINEAPNMIISLVSETRKAFLSGERMRLSGHIVVTLNDTFSLSIINNSHHYGDTWEGAAILELAILKNGYVIEFDNYAGISIVDGIDYHQLALLLKAVSQLTSISLLRLWSACFKLQGSRYSDYEPEAPTRYHLECMHRALHS